MRNSPTLSTSPSGNRDPHLKTHTNIQTTRIRNGHNRDVTSPPSSPLTSSSSVLSDVPEDGDYKERNGSRAEGMSSRRNTKSTSHDQSSRAFLFLFAAHLTKLGPRCLATRKRRNVTSQMSPAPPTSQPDDVTKLTQEVSIKRCHSTYLLTPR